MKHFILFLFTSLFLTSCTYYIGPNRWANKFDKSEINLPNFNTTKINLSIEEKVSLFENELQKYADYNHITWDSKFNDTLINPRIVFAKLLIEKDVFQINIDILNYKAWGSTGTSGLVNPYGDYDFAENLWTYLVWYFKNQPDILLPQTAKHIIDHLIIDNGNEPEKRAPNTLGFLRETENHILMKETSRYLKNQWLFEQYNNPKNNNKTNGMEDFMIHHLEEILKTGFYEFNSNPYISYTFEALHVLYNYTASPKIESLCKQIMDAENYQYALGSYQLKKYGPFRRRLSRESVTALDGDRHNTLIKIQLSKYYNEYKEEFKLNCCFDKSLVHLTSKYILPQYIVEIIKHKPETYYAKIGHGIKSSPEIYYGNSNYLISAGGYRTGAKSQIVPRPTTIFLNDTASTINDCIHIIGKGKLNKWNNTGVYKNFAVANHNVTVPEKFNRIEQVGNWSVYQPYAEKNIFICIFNLNDFGLIYVSENEDYKTVLNNNLDPEIIQSNFYFSNIENITYNVNKRKRWIIKSINNVKQERRFGKWKRFEVVNF